MKRLKELREERGLSQTKLAQRADLNPATVNRIELGIRPPSITTLQKLSSALGVDPTELLPLVTPPVSPSSSASSS